MVKRRAKLIGVVATAAALCSATVARADQGGVSFWVPGIYASMAAVPPDPGFSMPSTFWFYSGKGDRSDRFGIGGLITTGVEVKDLEISLLGADLGSRDACCQWSAGAFDDGDRCQ